MNDHVWIVNHDNQHDFSSAEKFGKLKTLTTGKLPVFQATQVYKAMAEKIKSEWKDGDYLLLSGAGIVQGLAIVAVLEHHPIVRLLQYHAKKRDYVPVDFVRPSEWV